MASTYSPKLRLELIGAGEQAGLWGTTTNKNVGLLLEQAIAGMTTIDLTAEASPYTLITLDGAPDQSRSAVIYCIGTPAANKTIVIPTQTKLYVIRNGFSDSSTLTVKTSGQTGGVVLKSGEATLVFCDGTNAILGLETAAAGVLGVSGGGTGASTFTAGFVKSPGAQGALTTSSTINLATDVTGQLGVANGGTTLTGFTAANRAIYSTSASALTAGTLPVAAGGTGATTLTTGGLVLGNGTSAVTTLTGGTVGYVPTWNGTTWVSSAAAAAGVSSFSAGTTGLTPSVATTGAVVLAGKLATANGGTNLTSFTANGAMYATSTSVLTTGTLPVASGGTGGTTLDGAGIVTKTGTQTVSGAKTFSSNIRVNTGSGNSEVRLGPSGTDNWGISYDSLNPAIGIGYSHGNYLIVVDASASTGYAEFTASTVYKPGGGSFTATSDARLKENIVGYTKGLSEIKTLNPVNYNFNDVTGLGKQTEHKTLTGLIAQEVEQTEFSSMIFTGDKGYRAIDASELTYALINAVKELSAQVDALKLEVAKLKGE